MADRQKPEGMSDEGWAAIDKVWQSLTQDDQEAMVQHAEKDEPQPTDMNAFLGFRPQAQEKSDEDEEDEGASEQ